MSAPPMGDNNGPTMHPGTGWRTHFWRRARRGLLGQLPLNVIRRRVARAKALGLECPTYATIRASGGQDIIGFLFSSNALRFAPVAPRLPVDRATHLASLDNAARIALVLAPHAAAE